MTDLVDKSEFHAHGVRNSGCSLCPSGIRTDNNGILPVRDLLLNVPLLKWASVQVVDRDIEKSLVLRVVQVHGDDMIRTGGGK